MLVGELFAGIGGFSLGLERAGMTVAWQVEVDPFCRAVLEKHWPDVPRYGDVRDVRGDDVAAVDLLCGGFPCQDVSDAGLREGIDGSRSGLWAEFDRLIGELRPRFVLVENTPGLVGRGLERVLGDLAARGYDAEWDCISTTAVGASQGRPRLYLVAYRGPVRCSVLGAPYDDDRGHEHGNIAHGCDARMGRAFPAGPGSADVSPQPYILRSDARIPNKSHRIAALGNAVCPQVAEMIGRRLLAADVAHLESCDLDADCTCP